MLLAFFSWWYGRGWRSMAQSLIPRLQGVSDSFSVVQLSKTLFAPWRRIITPPGRSLEDKMRAWGDNMFSRIIGFIVRIFVLIGAGVVAIIVGLITIAEIITWPLLPAAVPVLIAMGLAQ